MDVEKIKGVREKQAEEFRYAQQTAKIVTAINKSGQQVSEGLKQTGLSGEIVRRAVGEVVGKIDELVRELEKQKPQTQDNSDIVTAINDLKGVAAGIPKAIAIPKPIKFDQIKVSNQIDYTPFFKELTKALQAIDVKPAIKIEAPKLDLSDFTKAVNKLQTLLKVENKGPEINIDLGPVVQGLSQVTDTLSSLKFPVPNYVLPYLNSAGKASQVQLDSSGNVPVAIASANVTLNASDIEIGAVELKNGADDTRATITPANALKVDGSAATQPVSGAVSVSNMIAAVETGLAKDTSIGSLTEAAPATDTASSGLNGRLQRIAQRLTSVIALLPGSLGQKARAASLAVTLSSEDVTALTPPAAITGFALDATLTGGSAKEIVRGGQKGTTNTNADITHTASGANHELLDVGIYDAAGNLKDPTQIRALTSADVVALNPETTKVLGVTRTADGAGNLLTSNNTAPAGKFALDQNILSILGTAPTAAGKLDVKAADGDVFVRQATGSNLHTVVDTLPALVAGAALIGKVGIDQTTPGTTNAVTDTKLPATAALADATANPTLTAIQTDNSVFNGTSWDRQRGMSLATTTGDTGAKTATGNGATQTNVGNKGLFLVIALGTVSGTSPTAVFKLQGSADGGATWVDIPGATTASLVATGNWGISLFPGQAVTAGTTVSGSLATANGVLPRSWRVVWTIGGTTPSFTITSITYNYLPY